MRAHVPLSSAAAVAAIVAACSSGGGVEHRSAVEHGRDLFFSVAASESSQNKFSCSTCHRATDDSDDRRILAGATLAGAVDRPTFWGGKVVDLLRAINDCRYYFMNATRDWTPDDEPAKAMYAFLASLPKTATGPQPFTLVPIAQDLLPGDAARGEQVFASACRACHGQPHTGRDRLKDSIPTLPEESVKSFQSFGFDRTQVRTVFVEKVRHGGFLGLYGNMPPFSTDAMSDADLASLLSFLSLY
jgi:thiosulfate dehydrogenase